MNRRGFFGMLAAAAAARALPKLPAAPAKQVWTNHSVGGFMPEDDIPVTVFPLLQAGVEDYGRRAREDRILFDKIGTYRYWEKK